MTHFFQFDPNAILGVSPGASLSEIRDAYHQKSLKHHPDKGGDEWAFLVVTQAYETLSTARVVDRASGEDRRPTPTPAWSHPEPEPTPANSVGPSAANAGVDPESAHDVKWGGPPRSHAGESPDLVAKIVASELLILRFELEMLALDLLVRSAEDRNLSCTLHASWPVADLPELAMEIPDAAKILKKIGNAFKAREVRKHALQKKSTVEHGRFEGWLTYPTAVIASEALRAFREALAKDGLKLENQVREMAIPRPRR